MSGRVPEKLKEFRWMGDPEADILIQEIFSENGEELRFRLNSITSNSELFYLSGLSDNFDTLLNKMTLPNWMDQEKVTRAKALFQTYTLPILGLLGIYSLPYCYAAANGARVLIHSKNILQNPQKRLSETARFVTDIFSENSFDKKGKGLASIFKVRLMHAKARYYASRHIKDEIPVNQEDLAGTNLAFSLICLRGLQKSGIELSKSDWNAYIHFWNVVGYLLGIQHVLLPETISSAAKLERDIRIHQFRFSFEGKQLTDSLVNMLNQQNEFKSIFGAGEVIHFFMGNEVAEYVGLSRSNPITSALMTGIKIRNFLYDYSKSRYEKIVKLVENQVEETNGSYFKI